MESYYDEEKLVAQKKGNKRGCWERLILFLLLLALSLQFLWICSLQERIDKIITFNNELSRKVFELEELFQPNKESSLKRQTREVREVVEVLKPLTNEINDLSTYSDNISKVATESSVKVREADKATTPATTAASTIRADSQIKPECPGVIALHFIANASNRTDHNKRQQYLGNGKFKISEFYQDWSIAAWMDELELTKYFSSNFGNVTVNRRGLYLIYAQIYYSNRYARNGYRILKNSEPVSQCVTTNFHSDNEENKSHTCSVLTVVLLEESDKICIKDLHGDRHVLLTPEKSYFGLVLLKPLKNKM